MKSVWLSLIVAGICAGSARGQITVQVVQEQDQFLQGEAIPVAVRITNRSGQTLSLGTQDDWLTFTVESQDRSGIVVQKIADVPVAGEFVLESSKVATKRVNLEPYFAIGQPGRYSVVATLKVPNWDREVDSPPRIFTVIRGARLWEQAFGVPGSTNTVPETRKYVLQQANYLQGRIGLYLRLTDGADRVLRLVPVGSLVSFSRPEPQLDRDSKLHLLYQYGPRSFSYAVYDSDARLLKRQTHDYVGTRPRLKLDSEGEVTVVGGVRRVLKTDVPEPIKDDSGELVDPTAKPPVRPVLPES